MTASSRLHPPARTDVGPDEREAYDEITARIAERGDSEISPYIAGMLSSPTIGVALNAVGKALRLAPTRSATYDHRDFELIVHALGVDAGLIEPHHILDALAQDVPSAALEAVLEGRDDDLQQEDRLIVDFARRVVRGTMDDQAWNAVREWRGERGAVEISLIAGFVSTTMRWQLAWGVRGASPEEVREMLRRHRDGTLELPDKQLAIRAR